MNFVLVAVWIFVVSFFVWAVGAFRKVASAPLEEETSFENAPP
jgi:hypothetical protein